VNVTTGQHEIIESVVLVILPLGESPGAKEASQSACGFIEQVLNPRTITRPDRVTLSNPQGKVTVGLNNADARVRLRDILKGVGYKPAEGDAGTIRDLFSHDRLNLVVDTAVSLACSYRNRTQGQEDLILDMYPAQELVRVGWREGPRDWPKTWVAAGGELFGERMIAVKNSRIWTRISAFRLPFPPFDLHSGMGVSEISRKQATELGLLVRNERVPVEPIRLNPRFRQLLEQRLKTFVTPPGQQEQAIGAMRHNETQPRG